MLQMPYDHDNVFKSTHTPISISSNPPVVESYHNINHHKNDFNLNHPRYAKNQNEDWFDKTVHYLKKNIYLLL
jgi:hypothetical protein